MSARQRGPGAVPIGRFLGQRTHLKPPRATRLNLPLASPRAWARPSGNSALHYERLMLNVNRLDVNG